MPLLFNRSFSDESLYGGLIERTTSRASLFGSLFKSEQNDKSLILTIGELGTAEECCKTLKIFKKRKAPTKGKTTKAEYRKNICGYITKKVIREFSSSVYIWKVRELC